MHRLYRHSTIALTVAGIVVIATACDDSTDNGSQATEDAGTFDAGPVADASGPDPAPVDSGSDSGEPTDAGDSGSASGLDPAKRVVDLSSAERAQICDWNASLVGGYGVTFTCDGGSMSSAPDQAACVAGIPAADCEATVAEYENCARRIAADACTGFGSSECAPIVACIPS